MAKIKRGEFPGTLLFFVLLLGPIVVHPAKQWEPNGGVPRNRGPLTTYRDAKKSRQDISCRLFAETATGKDVAKGASTT
jgi:hypothetical protein